MRSRPVLHRRGLPNAKCFTLEQFKLQPCWESQGCRPRLLCISLNMCNKLASWHTLSDFSLTDSDCLFPLVLLPQVPCTTVRSARSIHKLWRVGVPAS